MTTLLSLDDALREMALRAAQAVRADYAGLDNLPVEGGGYSVIEVNGISGRRALQMATGADVVDHLVVYVLEESANQQIDGQRGNSKPLGLWALHH